MRKLTGMSYYKELSRERGGLETGGYWLASVSLRGPGVPSFSSSGYDQDNAEYNAAETLRQTGFRGWVEFDRGFSQTSKYRVMAEEVRPKDTDNRRKVIF